MMISKEDAYKAMYSFLDAYFQRGKCLSDDIGGLLGSMQLDSDGRPFDSAFEEDWDDAIKSVLESNSSHT